MGTLLVVAGLFMLAILNIVLVLKLMCWLDPEFRVFLTKFWKSLKNF
jgi:hypothetical protein